MILKQMKRLQHLSTEKNRFLQMKILQDMNLEDLILLVRISEFLIPRRLGINLYFLVTLMTVLPDTLQVNIHQHILKMKNLLDILRLKSILQMGSSMVIFLDMNHLPFFPGKTFLVLPLINLGRLQMIMLHLDIHLSRLIQVLQGK